MFITYKEDTEKKLKISRDYEAMAKMQVNIKNVIDDVICIKEVSIYDNVRYDNIHHIAVVTNESDHIASINIIDTDTYKSVAKGCSVSARGKLNKTKIYRDAIELLITQLCMYYK